MVGDQATHESDRLASRRIRSIFLALWLANLMVFLFLSVGVYLVLIAIRRCVVTTFEFRPDSQSAFGVRPVGLRLRRQSFWANALWLLSSLSAFGLAAVGLIFVNTSVLALLRR